MAQLPDTGVGFRPLYVQVREKLTQNLADGRWQPGMMLPSEQELARELQVSQGTVRKALDAMTADRILVRRQGRGTFVAAMEESRILFQFFRLYPDEGDRLFPTSRLTKREQAKASAGEREALKLEKGAPVFRIHRSRMHSEHLLLHETLSVSAKRFPDLGTLQTLPNNIYQLYSQQWGITITSASEKLKAVLSNESDEAALNCGPNTPLLQIQRIAYDISGVPVEYRESRCLTDRMHYWSELR